MPISKKLLKILACPNCRNLVKKTNNGFICAKCQSKYQFNKLRQLDFRLHKKKVAGIDFEIGEKLKIKKNIDFNLLVENPYPKVDFSDIKIPRHLSREILSYFPKAKDKNIMLDLGCGAAIHRKVCERAGFFYTGLDYSSTKALILADAHALPFKTNSFDFILSIAVLEHIRFPFVMIKEIHRVLSPKAKFIGTVAFLEAFHGNSFYHFTHLGILNLLQYGGFKIEKIAPSEKWSVLQAQAGALFPLMPQVLSRALISPLEEFHKLWWWLGGMLAGRKQEKRLNRILTTTGAFTFIAKK